MSYSEIMIQAYAKAKGITREEAIKHFGSTAPVAKFKKKNIQLIEQKAQKVLSDLRKDSKEIPCWLSEYLKRN